MHRILSLATLAILASPYLALPSGASDGGESYKICSWVETDWGLEGCGWPPDGAWACSLSFVADASIFGEPAGSAMKDTDLCDGVSTYRLRVVWPNAPGRALFTIWESTTGPDMARVAFRLACEGDEASYVGVGASVSCSVLVERPPTPRAAWRSVEAEYAFEACLGDARSCHLFVAADHY